MNIWSNIPAIVYLWSVFRHSPDIVSTFLALSPADQTYMVGLPAAICVAIVKWIRK